jgi:hypothetical protein
VVFVVRPLLFCALYGPVVAGEAGAQFGQGLRQTIDGDYRSGVANMATGFGTEALLIAGVRGLRYRAVPEPVVVKPVSAAGESVAANTAVTGETAATITGKSEHRQFAAERRASGDFDLVNQPIADAAGNPIQVTRRVDLQTGQPVTQSGLQSAVPDAVRYDRNLILDDKPLGRPISKDRQEVIRFIRTYEESQGTLPKTIAIQRYDPATGRPVVTELYKPSDFLPAPRKR